MPPQYWEFICPQPSEDVLARYKAKGQAKYEANKPPPKPKKQKKRKANLVENAPVELPVSNGPSGDNFMRNI